MKAGCASNGWSASRRRKRMENWFEDNFEMRDNTWATTVSPRLQNALQCSAASAESHCFQTAWYPRPVQEFGTFFAQPSSRVNLPRRTASKTFPLALEMELTPCNSNTIYQMRMPPGSHAITMARYSTSISNVMFRVSDKKNLNSFRTLSICCVYTLPSEKRARLDEIHNLLLLRSNWSANSCVELRNASCRNLVAL
jgi:hypothetical protein